jgi:hypothetical protein
VTTPTTSNATLRAQAATYREMARTAQSYIIQDAYLRQAKTIEAEIERRTFEAACAEWEAK